MIKSITMAACFLATVSAVQAQDVRITTFKTESTFSLNGTTFSITRDQNPNAVLEGEFARTSRACPPNCLQPMVIADGVKTLGELEVLRFLETTTTDGRGLLVDVRSPQDFANAAIPGAVNVPVVTLMPENRFRPDIFRALGATPLEGDAIDFSDAMELAFYSGGVWSAEASTAIRNLLDAGYPSEKLYFYRGGMQAWVHVGLSTTSSSNPG